MSKLLRSLLMLSFMACFFQVNDLFAFTWTMDTATPSGTDAPSEGDDRIRELKSAFVERLQVEHTFPASGTTHDGATVGYHKVLRLPEQSSAPSTPAGYGVIYTKDTGGQPEAFFREESSGDEVQITTGGKLKMTIVTADLPDGVQIQKVHQESSTGAEDANGNVTDDVNAFLVTEGSQLFSQAFTPNATTNLINVQVIVQITHEQNNANAVVGLFNTDVHATNALATGVYSLTGNNGGGGTVVFEKDYLASDLNGTTETTFKVRYGCDNGSVMVNEDVTNVDLYGGTLTSSITITETVAS